MNQSVIERYRGRWVGLTSDGAVVADAAQLDELLDKLDECAGIDATVQRVPEANEPLFVGLR